MSVTLSAAVDQTREIHLQLLLLSQPSSSTDGMINYQVSVCNAVFVTAVYASMELLTQLLCLSME